MERQIFQQINNTRDFINYLKKSPSNLVLKFLEESTLPIKTREIIKYRCVEEKSFKETCKDFAISPAQQNLILKKALNKIKTIPNSY